MRYLLILLCAAGLASCVSSGKYKEYIASTEAQSSVQMDSIKMLQDSTLRLRLALERSRGGNDALLQSQDKYFERLATQEDELDQLRGNLTSTSFQMTNQLAKLKEQLNASGLKYDTLLADQTAIIGDFQDVVEEAANVIRKSFDGKVGDETFDIVIDAGLVTLSIQEELLFLPKSVDKLTEESPVVLRSVMDALQGNPLLKLTIVGHTDNKPNPRRNTNNWEYAALRATFLANELAQTYYLSPNRVIAASNGEYRPATSNATEEGRKKNRRVEFVLRNNVENLLRALGKLEK